MKFSTRVCIHFFITLLVIGLSSQTKIWAQSGLPSTEHPRIFLNSDIIQTLKNKMDDNTLEWQVFQQYLNVYMNEAPWGGQYLDAIPSFALAYLITGKVEYAERAIHFLDQWISELGATNPFYVNSDEYAHVYETIGLGFDWLYNYSGFTAQKKEAVISMMNRAYEFGQTPWDQGGGDFEADWHDSDQQIGGAKVSLIWGTATYGDNDNALTLINRSREIWDQTIYNWIVKSIGGVWPEGSQYSYNTLYFLFALTETERTANGINLWTKNPQIMNFPKNVITSLIWLTPPSNDHLLTYNSQEDENSLYWERRNHCTAINSYIADNLGFADEAASCRYWIRELSPNNIEMNVWKLLLWYDRNKPHINYFSGNLPKAYFAPGTDWMFLRSGWTSEASYSTFNASWTNIDHQFMDGGHFNIFRNGEYLTKQVRHYEFVFLINGKYQSVDGVTSNVMLIKSNYEDDEGINTIGSAESFASEGDAKITKHRINFSPLFVYSFAELGKSYNRIYDEWGGNSQRVKTYTRQFVQISPDYYFVCDRVRTTDSDWSKYILHSITEPTINGNLITQTSESGSQYLYNKTLFPHNVTITKVNEATAWTTANGLQEDWMVPQSERKWHSIVKPEISDSVNMLNVIETTGGTTSYIDAAYSIESNELFGGAINDWVVMFSKREGELNNASYQITGSSNTIKNLVCNLKPNYNYEISLNGSNILSVAAGKDGTIYFEINNLNGNGNIFIEQGTVSVKNIFAEKIDFQLKQNYPNPFNPSTKIKYSIPNYTLLGGVKTNHRVVSTKLIVYDILGREVAVLVNKQQQPGNYEVTFNPNGLPSGVYIYRIQAGLFSKIKKMVLLK